MVHKRFRLSLISVMLMLLTPAVGNTWSINVSDTIVGEPDRGYDRMRKERPAFHDFVKKAVELLAKGQEESFTNLFTEGTLKAHGDASVRKYVHDSLLPFFAGYTGLGNNVTIYPTHDANGNEGYSFYMTIKTPEKEKPFAIYVVREDGQMGIANIIINKTYKDLH
jgi:hypothetical protein